MRLRTRKLASVLAVASTFMAATAGAQQAAGDAANTTAPATGAPTAQPASRNSDQLQTVMVTANKRKEDSSKVATSISVISGDDLVAQHIGDFADMTRSIPNISFSGGGGGGDAGNGPGLSNIEMRGVSSTGGSATVGVYLDDVSMTVANLYSMGSAEPKFFDLDRVEVLRGPQGTLYGASSMGGTVKFISNQPNLKAQEGSVYTEVSGSKGGGTSYTGNAVFNQPIIPGELALRVGIQGGHQAGYINQVSQDTGAIISPGINKEDDSVVRVALKWAPTRDLTITPSVFYQKVRTGDIDVAYTQTQTGLPLPINQTSKIVREPGNDKLLVPSLTVNYDTGFGDLTSITSFFQRNFSRIQDGSTINSVVLGTQVTDPALAAVVGALPSQVILGNQVRQFSQELRIASRPYDPSVSPFTWVGGAYAANMHTNVAEHDPVNGINAAFNAAGYSPSDPDAVAGAVTAGFPNDDSYAAQYHYHNRQTAVFGEANYYFAPTLHATAGIRYLQAKSSLEGTQALYYNNDGTNDGYSYNNISTTGNKATPKFALTWEVDPTDTVYASAAEGFRLGGASLKVPQGLCGLANPSPLTYAADSLWSYELGDKSRFLNNRLSVNASLFYIKWKNMQQDIELACDYNYDTNVGAATSYGAEVEIKAKPTSNLVFDLAAGVTHATLSDSDGQDAGILGAVKGANIPGVPKFNMALTATYNFNLNDDWYGFVRAGAHWTGTSNGGYSLLANGEDNPDFHRPSYSTLDASAGLSYGKWDWTIFVKNMGNNQKVIQRPIVQATTDEVYRIEPRSIGISLGVKM